MNFIGRLLNAAVTGFEDGFWTCLNPKYDPQEAQRQRIILKTKNKKCSNDEIHKELLEYCREFDPKLRLKRTEDLIIQIKEQRPTLFK